MIGLSKLTLVFSLERLHVLLFGQFRGNTHKEREGCK